MKALALYMPEAMSQEFPVIYTRGQGFDGHFEDGGVGFAVDFFEIDEIVAQIEKVFESYAVVSSNCLERIGRFSWINVSEACRKAYEKL